MLGSVVRNPALQQQSKTEKIKRLKLPGEKGWLAETTVSLYSVSKSLTITEIKKRFSVVRLRLDWKTLQNIKKKLFPAYHQQKRKTKAIKRMRCGPTHSVTITKDKVFFYNKTCTVNLDRKRLEMAIPQLLAWVDQLKMIKASERNYAEGFVSQDKVLLMQNGQMINTDDFLVKTYASVIKYKSIFTKNQLYKLDEAKVYELIEQIKVKDLRDFFQRCPLDFDFLPRASRVFSVKHNHALKERIVGLILNTPPPTTSVVKLKSVNKQRTIHEQLESALQQITPLSSKVYTLWCYKTSDHGFTFQQPAVGYLLSRGKMGVLRESYGLYLPQPHFRVHHYSGGGGECLDLEVSIRLLHAGACYVEILYLGEVICRSGGMPSQTLLNDLCNQYVLHRGLLNQQSDPAGVLLVPSLQVTSCWVFRRWLFSLNLSRKVSLAMIQSLGVPQSLLRYLVE